MGKREGYLMVDHRASPGLSAEEARLAGYDPLMCREGKLLEMATLTCSHCKCTVVKSHQRTRERPSCAKCGGHYICDICAFKASLPDYSHAPFDKVIDDTLTRAAMGSPTQLLLP